MLNVKQGGIKYHFLSVWYDSTWDWTPVSGATGEHSNCKKRIILKNPIRGNYQNTSTWYQNANIKAGMHVARCLIGRYFSKILINFGQTGNKKKRNVIHRIIEKAETATKWLWYKKKTAYGNKIKNISKWRWEENVMGHRWR